MNKTVFDVAVAGLGTMGSFACLELVRRGLSVVGFDRFRPPHDQGSHSGDTRLFRTAYAEHPAYVPLAQRAGILWDQWREETGTQLLERCGLLSMGPPSSELIRGTRMSASLHNLPVEEFTATEIRRSFPALAPPDEYVGLLERSAGWLDVDTAIRMALERASAGAARLVLDCPVTSWERDGTGIRINTSSESFGAEKLIVTAGAWAGELLRDLGTPLQVQRKLLAWLKPTVPEWYALGRCPIFVFEDHFFYGFPNIGQKGVKAAIHLTSGSDDDDVRPIVDLAARYLRGLDGQVLGTKTCLYTMTADQHFIIDRHPREENVYIAAGFSGHGFKFATVIAEALADLATKGSTELPVDFLRLNRFSTVSGGAPQPLR